MCNGKRNVELRGMCESIRAFRDSGIIVHSAGTVSLEPLSPTA